MTVWWWVDAFGVFVFALSGALAAARKEMDLFGFMVLALMPAVGGGTLRDLLLGAPVFWIEDNTAVWLTLAAVLLTWSAARRIERRGQWLVWCDAVGLSAFCVFGAHKALAATGSPGIAVMLGVVTAVAGGLIRDVISNEVPLVLHREIYATAAFVGAATYCSLVLLFGLAPDLALWLGAAACFSLRAPAILRGWELPRFPGRPGGPRPL